MKYNKLKAFTLAEVMVLLLTLSILLAAFAPVFTRRYHSMASDEVWTYVPRGADVDTKDAYYDTPNRKYRAQAFIGLSPKDASDVQIMTDGVVRKNVNRGVISQDMPPHLPSKLTIAATNANLNPFYSTKYQNQIQFRYSTGSINSSGTLYGSLYAGNGNMLLGGPYKDILYREQTEDSVTKQMLSSGADYNTAYGYRALEKLTTGDFNTAVGNQALPVLTTGHSNTALGQYAGRHLSKDDNIANVLVGVSAGSGQPGNYPTNKSNLNYNTLIGYYAGSYDNVLTSLQNNNTAIGYQAMYKPNSGVYYRKNTVVGHQALMDSNGAGNVAVGYQALYKSKGSFNTAVGAYAGYLNDNAKESNYKTFIGYNSGKGISEKLLYVDSKNIERVFIGSTPVEHVGASAPTSVTPPGAVLEVHNIDNINANSLPMPNMGESSVVINGNLIVRGNTYFEAPIVRQGSVVDIDKVYREWKGMDEEHISENVNPNLYYPKGLVLFKLFKYTQKEYEDDIFGNSYLRRSQPMNIFGGFDGIQRSERSYEKCHKKGMGHAYKDVRPNCICTAVRLDGGLNSEGSPNVQETTKNGYDLVYNGSSTQFGAGFKQLSGSNSYDWFSKTRADISLPNNPSDPGAPYRTFIATANGVYNSKDFDTYYKFDKDNYGFTGETLEICKYSGDNYMGSFESNVKPWEAAKNGVSGYYNFPPDKFNRPIGCTRYEDKSLQYLYVTMERRAGNSSGVVDSNPYKGTDFSYAHLNYPRTRSGDYEFEGVNEYDSCCPVLIDEQFKDPDLKSSDRRLKDVGEQFTAGLDEIRKLNVYNYTFKNDKNKLPQVGVIAQDLRLVFPKAVTKDENGYYKIRWDEMFYAAVNAIKTLNTKIESFVVKVEKDKQRIAQLKKDNTEMNIKLDELSKELTRLEKLAARKNNK